MSSRRAAVFLSPLNVHGRGLGFVFFFQAEDGIRDDLVTGVQTCALPISPRSCCRVCIPNAERRAVAEGSRTRGRTSGPGTAIRWNTPDMTEPYTAVGLIQIGRASCRERV